MTRLYAVLSLAFAAPFALALSSLGLAGALVGTLLGGACGSGVAWTRSQVRQQIDRLED